MDTPDLLWLGAIVLIVLGFAGVLLPVIPGSILLMAGFFLGALADDFTYIGWGTLAVLLALAILMQVIEFFLGAVGARRYGASKRGIIGGMIGALGGIFLGLPGIIFGPFIGAVLGELSAQRDLHAAGRAGLGTTIGLVIGSAAKLAIAFSMVCIFVVMRFM
jgi:hypothetical protein